VKTFHCFNTTKKLPHGDFQFFEKRVAFGLILMAEKPQKSDKRQRDKNFQLCAPFEGNVPQTAAGLPSGQA
jgi:hypothetical protein